MNVYLFAGIAVVVAIFCGLVFAKVSGMANRMGVLEKKIGVEIKPAWRYVFKVAAAELIHPHKRYEETDTLLAEALLEPEVPMKPERLELLNQKLEERSHDTSSDMRPGEQSAALVAKHALVMLKLEGKSGTALSDITMVGSQQPQSQMGADGVMEDPTEKVEEVTG